MKSKQQKVDKYSLSLNSAFKNIYRQIYIEYTRGIFSDTPGEIRVI